ncbi:MAG TPA: ornithine carbamoyltransferase [Acidothermaceae bacterium]
MTARHFLIDDDLQPFEVRAILDQADHLKKDRLALRPLAGPRSVAVLFEKQSTRTRVSFEVGIAELGGHPLIIDARTSQLGRGEPIEDTGRVLSRYVSAIVLRTYGHERIEALAASASVPVVNALSDLVHPCQWLADLMTIREHRGEPAGQTITYVGDGNNVAHSILLGGVLAGMHVRVAAPVGYEPLPEIVERAEAIAVHTGGSVAVTDDPIAAATDVDVLYTDVWASMGQEEESATRQLAFAPYQLDDRLVALAADDVMVLHCLPAHRGEEISASVLDGPHSFVFDQAENRLHAQKALLAFLLDQS